MAQRLVGKVAVVTGASRGMGLAISQVFAAEGARVAMLARSGDELEKSAAGVEGAKAFPCDIGDPDAVRAVFACVEVDWGGVDVLINNAGVATPEMIADISDEAAQHQVTVNILGATYCMREAIAAMKRRGGGDIVNVSSESVQSNFPMMTFYAATKAALETLSMGARAQLRGSNIRVTIYRSGRVKTTFGRHWTAEQREQTKLANQGTGAIELSGEAIDADIPARAILSLVLLDRSAHIDIMQLRGS